jgi:hypothetical protein
MKTPFSVRPRAQLVTRLGCSNDVELGTAEASLAHAVPNAVEAAYKRIAFFTNDEIRWLLGALRDIKFPLEQSILNFA